MRWFSKTRDKRKIERLRAAKNKLLYDLYTYDEYASSLSASESSRLRKKLNNSIHRFLDLGGDVSKINWGDHSNLYIWAREERKEYPGRNKS